MELLQSQAPVEQELSGPSASARHGTSDIGHQTWDIGHKNGKSEIIAERLSLEGTKMFSIFQSAVKLKLH